MRPNMHTVPREDIRHEWSKKVSDGGSMIKHVIYGCLLAFYLLAVVSKADELFVFITRDPNGTNLIQTWCGHPVTSDDLKSKMGQLVKHDLCNQWKMPLRFTSDITVKDLFSTIEALHSAGLTNLSLQRVSNAVPRDKTNKREVTLTIEDYSQEPVLVMPRILWMDSGTNRNSSSNRRMEGKLTVDPDDLPVNTDGL